MKLTCKNEEEKGKSKKNRQKVDWLIETCLVGSLSFSLSHFDIDLVGYNCST